MLGIVSMAGNALKAFGNTHPAVKWGVIVLAFLLAAEFVGKEGISLYRDMVTLKWKVEQTHAESCTAQMNALAQTKPGAAVIDTGGAIAARREYEVNCSDYVPAPKPELSATETADRVSLLPQIRKRLKAANPDAPEAQITARAKKACLAANEPELCGDAN